MLKIKDIDLSNANMHTHTRRCNHAGGTDREYVEAAIEAGFSILGFSDHSPYDFKEDYVSHIRMGFDEVEGYVRSIDDLRNEYKKDITIYTGFEMEYFPALFEDNLARLQQYPIDYLLCGQHCFDTEVGHFSTRRPWDDEEHLALYVERVTQAIDRDIFFYIAHPDLMYYTGPVDIYKKHMSVLVDALKAKNLPAEVNLGGLGDGCNYPNPVFMQLAADAGLEFIIGVDAHSPKHLLDTDLYRQAVEMVDSLGGKLINRRF